MFGLQPPRHISTLPNPDLSPAALCLLPSAADMTPLQHWAAMCQEATYATQQKAALFDHLGGAVWCLGRNN